MRNCCLLVEAPQSEIAAARYNKSSILGAQRNLSVEDPITGTAGCAAESCHAQRRSEICHAACQRRSAAGGSVLSIEDQPSLHSQRLATGPTGSPGNRR